MSWSVWVQVPGTSGWSRMFGGLMQEDAEWVAEECFFAARAMPEEEKA